jgi:hypothetical protein
MPLQTHGKNYLVVVMDMYNYGESYKRSYHETYQEALNVVKEVIKSSFSKSGLDGVDEWFAFGETAYIVAINGAPSVEKFDDAGFVYSLCGVSADDVKLRDLKNFCRSSGRICPMPNPWMHIHRMIQQATPKTKVPSPLILAAWHITSDDEKLARFVDHLDRAHAGNILAEIDKYLRALAPNDWWTGAPNHNRP